jgi:hypothetical protein
MDLFKIKKLSKPAAFLGKQAAGDHSLKNPPVFDTFIKAFIMREEYCDFHL